MSSESAVAGSCLCGAVKYEISGNLGIFQYCHCSRCRKFTGSAFAANIFVSPTDFRWLQGEDKVGRFELEGAKHFATCFCQCCGSSLPWHTQSGRAVIVPAGTLDADPGLRPQGNTFYVFDAPWYVEPNELPKFAELPPRGGN